MSMQRLKKSTCIAIFTIIMSAVVTFPGSGNSAENKITNSLYAIRSGVFIHDIDILGSSKENGFDLNVELLFQSPEWLECIWAPHPHIGVAIHSQGETNQIYSGLTWEKLFKNNYFMNIGLGLSLHDGNQVCSDDCHEKELGCALLFREAIEAGYQISEHHTLSIIFFHISNARLCRENDGMNHLGVRYGYSF
jgi:lipid A 3-O-deacylase